MTNRKLWLDIKTVRHINELRREIAAQRTKIWKVTQESEDTFDYFRCGQMDHVLEVLGDALFDVLNHSAAHYDDKRASEGIDAYRI